VSNPAAEVFQVAHTGAGLLTDFVDPRSHAHHFEYAPDGRLTKDVDATPGSPGTRLVTTSDASGWSVDITSPEGRVTHHRVDRAAAFSDPAVRERRTVTVGGVLPTTVETFVDEAKTAVYPDGTTIAVLEMAPDPRWGLSAAYPATTRIDVGYPTTTHSMTLTQFRDAPLTTPSDPFSVTRETIAMTRSASGLPTAHATHVFAPGPPATWTTTTTENRQIQRTLDSLERITKLAILGSEPGAPLLHPLELSYDTHGRVEQITWGSRVFTQAYDPVTGWLNATTAPEGLGVTYDARDAAGRPILITLPGARQLGIGYDPSGNVTAVTPPAKPSHAFAFDRNDRLETYVPPDVVPALAPKDTPYARDLDGLLLLAKHPGKPISYAYDLLGRLSQSTAASPAAITTTYTHDARGRLATIATSDGVTLTYGHDGLLPTQQSVAGPFAHAINKTYDDYLRLSSWNIDGATTVTVGYDGDDLVTGTGGMAVDHSVNGLLRGTTVGSVTDAFTYNAYGELATHAVSGSDVPYTVDVSDRDDAGRIRVKTETIGAGPARSFRYEYDDGRLARVYEDGAVTPTREWTYDDNGNRAGGTYDDQDRLRQLDTTTFTYGNNGELATRTGPSGSATYAYDPHGNLRSVTRAAPAVPAQIDYVIDGSTGASASSTAGCS